MTLTLRLLTLLCFSLSLASGSPVTNAVREILTIARDPSKYDKNILPKESGPIHVSINMFLRSIEVDDVNMRTFVDMTFRMMWRDYRLKYSEPGVPQVRLTDSSLFWLPDPFFKGSIETKQLKTIYPEAYIGFTKRGNVTFSTRFHVSLKCNMDLSRFPHDTQFCPIMIASYGFATDDVIFRFAEDVQVEVQREKNRPISNRIHLKDFKIAYCDSITSTGKYSCLEAILELKRNFSTYLYEWYMPCISLVIIAFFSELIVIEALLPRLVLTIGPLLTLIASSLSYGTKTASVPYATALDVFTGISLLTIFVTTLHVIIGYYYHTKEPSKEPNTTEEPLTKVQRLKNKLREKGDYAARIVIIGFYCIFLFLYFLAYSM